MFQIKIAEFIHQNKKPLKMNFKRHPIKTACSYFWNFIISFCDTS